MSLPPSPVHPAQVDQERLGLTGKVAIVTGAAAAGDGMPNGRAAAISLARYGAKVACVGRTPEHVERTAAIIEAEGGAALPIRADVTSEVDCRRVVETTLQRFGQLDLLDNNVGSSSPGTVVDTELRAWRAAWQRNVESMVLMSKYAIPAMTDTSGGGAIVNIGSLGALRPSVQTPYSTTKGAVIALTKAMAVDHGAAGIRVNCVVIGLVWPGREDRPMPAEQRELRRNASPLRVEGTSWDTAEAVCFLLSDRARYITGQALIVDGGASLVGPGR